MKFKFKGNSIFLGLSRLILLYSVRGLVVWRWAIYSFRHTGSELQFRHIGITDRYSPDCKLKYD